MNKGKRVSIELNSRLADDCVLMGESELSLLLLLNNSLVPWFIVVPKTEEVEFHCLDETLQLGLLKQINALAAYVNEHFCCEKMNIATIGNVVQQMHIHVVGRHSKDFCWPNVVWGASDCKPYTAEQIAIIRSATLDIMSDFSAIEELTK